MKTVVIPKDQFDNVVYIAVATANVEDWKEARLLSKILDKLESKATRNKNGGFELNYSETTIDFEDSEAEMVKSRLTEFMKQMQGWAAVQLIPLMDQLELDSDNTHTEE